MIKCEIEEKTIAIGEVKALLEMGYKIEVDSPDGWVNVSDFVDKGEWEEYVFECNNKRVICNEKHLFETNIGWKNAQELLEIQNNNSNESSLQILCDDSNYHTYKVEKTGNIVPIVDIHVDHDNHRYYTNGISSHNTGVGKSLVMCHLASSYLSQGLNVLYITMEMAEERIAERIDANLLDTRIDQLKNLSESSFTTKITDLSKKTRGKLLIKEYPTASAHAGHFRALLNELSLKKNFKPDIIFIDYLNICASSRIKGLSGGVNTYSLVKAIAEELRGLAVENNVPIWTATQVNRQGASNSDMELTDTSECIAITERVQLRDGSFKTMDEIEIGDQIKANDDYKTVMFRHHNKVKDCVKITTKSGKSIVVSKEHVFPTKTQDGSIKRLSVSDGLSIGDKLSVKK